MQATGVHQGVVKPFLSDSARRVWRIVEFEYFSLNQRLDVKTHRIESLLRSFLPSHDVIDQLAPQSVEVPPILIDCRSDERTLGNVDRPELVKERDLSKGDCGIIVEFSALFIVDTDIDEGVLQQTHFALEVLPSLIVVDGFDWHGRLPIKVLRRRRDRHRSEMEA